MSCFICGRSSCMPNFHSCDEQRAFEKAEEAFEKFLEIREKCREEFNASQEDEDLEEEE